MKKKILRDILYFLIQEGFHPDVDRLRHIMTHGKELLASIESREREKTGIKNF